MYVPRRSTARLPILGICAALLFANEAQAAAPLYFDLGGLILYGLLYGFGLVALPLLIVFSKKKGAKRFWSGAFVVCIVGPAVIVLSIAASIKFGNARAEEDRKTGENKNREAFGKYCKDRKRVVYSRVTPNDAASLTVRVERNFNGGAWQFNAYTISEFMRNKQALCQLTGLRTMEGVFDGKYSAEKKGYEKEVRRYVMCSDEKWLVDSETRSRYELLLGETAGKAPVPWGNEGGNWMGNSSVRIVDRLTGETLAEDAMYFLTYDTGEAGCPRGLDQLAELIVSVFPHQ